MTDLPSFHLVIWFTTAYQSHHSNNTPALTAPNNERVDDQCSVSPVKQWNT